MGITHRGQVDTKSWATDNRAREIQKDILLTEPDRAPLTTMLMAIPTKGTFSDKFEHAEYTYPPPTLGIPIADANVYASGDLSTHVLTTDASGSLQALRVKVGLQVFIQETGEIARTVAVNMPGNAVTLYRGAAGTTPGAIAANQVLVMSSEGNEEGVAYSDAIMQEPDMYDNYVEEFETAVEMSNIEMAIEDLTEDQWNFQVQVKAAEHKEKIERMLWLGGKEKVAGPNGRWMRYSGGILYFLRTSSLTSTTHYKSVGGGLLTKPFFDAWVVGSYYTFGDPNNVVLFVSPSGWLALSAIAEGPVETTKSDDTLGLTIRKVAINGRVYKIVENRAFALWGMNSMIAAVNMGAIRMRRLQNKGFNFQTEWKKNVQPNDVKGRKDVLYSIYGCQLPNFRAHAILYNFAIPQAA